MKFPRKIIGLFFFVILAGGLILFWLWDNYRQRSQEIMASEQTQVDNQYQATVNAYRLVSQTFFDEAVKQPEVIERLKRAAVGDAKLQAGLRQQLNTHFADGFKRLRQQNFRQLNFYLPDGTIFLNMNKPDDFGVNDAASRPTIAKVIASREPAQGFEEGRLFNGFRYVFPLLDDGQLIAVVETSVSLSTFEKELSRTFPLTYRFLIKKTVVGDVVHSGDVRSYEISDLNRDYYREIEAKSLRADLLSDEMLSDLNKQLSRGVRAKMSASQAFAAEAPLLGVRYLAVFLPVSNFSGQQVAYLSAYRQSDDLYFLRNDLYIRYIFVIALVIMVLLLIFYIYEGQSRLLDAGERLRNITAAMGEGLLVINQKKQVIFFNPAAEELTGFKLEEVLGVDYSGKLKFVAEDGKKSNQKFIKDILEGRLHEFHSKDIFIIQKDKGVLPLAVSASALANGNRVVGCIIVFRDVTKEREIDKAKTEFVSLASHQLKTPLSAVNWYAEMLMDEDAGQLNQRQKEFLKEIAEGNQRMVRLVNSLLNVSRIDMGTLSVNPEPVDLCQEAESVIAEQQFALEAKGLSLKKLFDAKLPKINLDRNLIRIVIQNLISNAIKYTREGGHVEVEIKGQDGKQVMLRVSDDGYGIPKKEQAQIFSKLFRADNVKSKKVEGTGLGLYVAKAVVEAFDGKIWFESIEDKGTSFFITLPLSGAKRREGTKGLEAKT